MAFFKGGNGADGAGKFIRADGVHQFTDPHGDFVFSAPEGGEIDPAAVIAFFSDERGRKEKGGQGPAAQFPGTLEEGSGSAAQLILRQVDMTGGSGGFETGS